MRQIGSVKSSVARTLSVGIGSAVLGACGGSDLATGTGAATAANTETLSMTLEAPPEVAQPSFHLAPVILEEPEDTDRTEPSASGTLAPQRAQVRQELAQLSTRRLTHRVMEQMLDTGSVPPGALAQGIEADPMASTSGVTVYTPAQIRAAYGLPALPAAGSSLTSAQAAQLGAGQTIYLIDAYHDPHAAAELAAFNTKFGLPACTQTSVSVSASLPIATALTTGCAFSVVYATSSGALTATAPAYDSGWATEIAIDVQWAHATAPYARIVLIEAPDAGGASLYAAAHLANTMGPGVVSMSFGAPEGAWMSSYDENFAASNMTYLAAAGDAGAEVEWPSASAHVVAVAGTSLTYSGTDARSESVWAGTGGGVSAYVAAPAYQGLAVPGLNKPSHREVSDVTFNADPYTGQYIAVISQSGTTPSWLSCGGTSLATPQWAGIIAVANALRAQNLKAVVGQPHSLLYSLATQQGSYASNFLDVTSGSDGTCSVCLAGSGYDLPSGLGSPNVASLLSALGGSPPVAAPVVSAASVAGNVGIALSFTLSASGPHALTYSLSSSPAGMSVNASSGLVSWKSPVAGSYAVVAQASDAQTGLSGHGTLSVSIVVPQPPLVTGASITGVAQTALTFASQVTHANSVTYSLSGAPSGMTVSTAGVVSWATPAAGTYAVTLTAHDATTGLSGHGVYTVTIAALKPPAVSAASISGTVGKSFSFTANVPWSNPLSFSVSGAPSGLAIAPATGLISWASPIAGKYSVTVAAKDTKTGLTGTGLYTVTINGSGPTIQAVTLSGVAGKAMSGTVSITDAGATAATITLSGKPAAMTTSISGNVITLKWSAPTIGSYSLHVTVVDSKNLTGTATIPLTITAH